MVMGLQRDADIPKRLLPKLCRVDQASQECVGASTHTAQENGVLPV